MYNDKNVPGTGGNSDDICFLPQSFVKAQVEAINILKTLRYSIAK